MSAVGAYGLRLDIDITEGRLLKAPSEWTPWRFSWTSDPVEAVQRWGSDLVRLRMLGGEWASIDRTTSHTTVHSADEPTPAAWAHPLMGATAVVNRVWSGGDTFHAGCVVVNGRVWAVLGEREAGKSSVLAWLHLNGFAVFSDDLLVLGADGSTAFAGPRCLDLRHGAATHFGIGRDIGVVGTRERWRVNLPECASELPFGGWVILQWTPRTVVERSALPLVVRGLIQHRAVRMSEVAAPVSPALITAPALSFGRERDWAQFNRSMRRLVSALEDFSEPAATSR